MGQTGIGFQTTCWDLVHMTRSDDGRLRDHASGELFRRYWSPVYAWIRRQGNDAERSEELTQAFFVEVVTARALWSRVEGGRMRSFLLASLRNYLVDVSRRERARGGSRRLSLEQIQHEEAYLDQIGSLDADTAFERRWSSAILEQAIEITRQHFVAIGKSAHWKAFEMVRIRPAVATVERPSHREVATACGFAEENRVASALRVVREHLEHAVVDVIRGTVPESDVSDEVESIRRHLGL